MLYQAKPVWTDEWKNAVLQVVYTDIMSKITADPRLISFAVTPPQSDYWFVCFTSPVFSTVNYDTLERIGDTILKLCITEKSYEMDPFIDPDSMSRILNYYGGNVINARVLKGIPVTSFQGINLGSLVLVDPSKDVFTFSTLEDKILADLYESILGAIKVIGSLYLKSRIGMELSYNWYEYTYKVTNTVMDLKIGNSITVLKQIFKRFNEKEIGVSLQIESEEKTFQVENSNQVVKGWRFVLPAKTFDELRELQQKVSIDGRSAIYNPSIVLGNMRVILIPSSYQPPYNIRLDPTNKYVIGEVDAIAKENAAEQALTFLRDMYGITPEWSSKAKEDLEILGDSNIGLATKNNFMNNLRKDGFATYEIKKLNKISNDSVNVVQLIGITIHGEKQVISVKISPGDVPSIKRSLYRDYAEKVF